MAVLWDTGIVCGCAVDDGTCYNGEENKEIKITPTIWWGRCYVILIIF